MTQEESFPTPLKYIDVIRSSHTDWDVAEEKRIDDYWDVDEIHIIERNSSKRTYVVGEETDKHPNDITSRSHMAWRLDKNWRSRSKKRKNKTRTCQKIERNLFYWSERRRIQRQHQESKAKVGHIKASCNAMQQSVVSSMHTGNRCIKNRKKPRHLKRRQDSIVSLKPMNPQDKE